MANWLRNLRHRAMRAPEKPLSPSQLFVRGNGDLSAPGVAALLAEADRGFYRELRDVQRPVRRTDYDPISNDAALLCTGMIVAPDARITMPSGETITGVEFQERARIALDTEEEQ